MFLGSDSRHALMAMSRARHPARNSPLLAVAIVLSCPVATLCHAAACSPVTAGVDTTHAIQRYNLFLGSAWGQAFEARDTVLEAISVWRDDPGNITPLRVWVLELDANGWPDVNRILRLGPTVQIADGDSIQRYRFVFDPPLVLPGAGHYEFAVQPAPPYCDFGAGLWGDPSNPYPGGGAWKHHRSFSELGCPLEFVSPPTPNDDLCFELEFCDTTTPVRPSSWGSVKIRYR